MTTTRTGLITLALAVAAAVAATSSAPERAMGQAIPRSGALPPPASSSTSPNSATPGSSGASGGLRGTTGSSGSGRFGTGGSIDTGGSGGASGGFDRPSTSGGATSPGGYSPSTFGGGSSGIPTTGSSSSTLPSTGSTLPSTSGSGTYGGSSGFGSSGSSSSSGSSLGIPRTGGSSAGSGGYESPTPAASGFDRGGSSAESVESPPVVGSRTGDSTTMNSVETKGYALIGPAAHNYIFGGMAISDYVWRGQRRIVTMSEETNLPKSDPNFMYYREIRDGNRWAFSTKAGPDRRYPVFFQPASEANPKWQRLQRAQLQWAKPVNLSIAADMPFDQ